MTDGSFETNEQTKNVTPQVMHYILSHGNGTNKQITSLTIRIVPRHKVKTITIQNCSKSLY